MVGFSYPVAQLAPFAANNLPIVVDTGASRSLPPVRADVTSFKKIHRRPSSDDGISDWINMCTTVLFYYSVLEQAEACLKCKA